MGRIVGTNTAKAVSWLFEPNAGFYDDKGFEVAICQWITFTDFADIQACLWRRA